MSHITHMSESCLRHRVCLMGRERCVYSNTRLIYKSCLSHMNESRHTHDWVISHMWISHVSNMNALCHTYEWVMPHTWMNHLTRHVTHMNTTRHAHIWVMSHMWVNHVSHMKSLCHTYRVCPMGWGGACTATHISFTKANFVTASPMVFFFFAYM